MFDAALVGTGSDDRVALGALLVVAAVAEVLSEFGTVIETVG